MMHGDDFFVRVLLAIPMAILLWLCVRLSGKFNSWLRLGSNLHKREKIPLSTRAKRKGARKRV